ncbi:hypothetical protein LEM8419_00201 [Neolewinella maritima]|uniref:HTH cro/C1-type domain-containing protein n=1 Tax=Neolewinella maritima TaxID=1383882 RepID=A0ABM9AWP2_9BACT|nr:hypothetical protein [Neolewinella maritima]CAH0998889.1 hypothetical protein LEM8419_00201 [Neolewinella maritima]
MNVKPIRNEQEYDTALARLDEIFDAPSNTAAGDEAEVLTLIIESYEAKHHPIAPPDPIETIRLRMDERNIKQKDLIGIIGGKSRVSEVLNRKKRLTLDMIRRLHDALDLPVEVLVTDYELNTQ